MDPLVLKKLNSARSERRAGMILTQLGDGRDRFVAEGEGVEGELGEAVRKAFQTGRSTKAEVNGEQFFLNVHVPPPRLVVIGAVHISQALAPIAEIAGYEMEVIDPRTAFATPDRFSNVALFADWPEDILEKRPLDPYTALAAVTHDPKIDDTPLVEALKAECFYVGALGSRKTHAKRVERFKNQGLSAALIEKINAPIGLDIGAASPQEIAVAVMAEVIQAFRRRGLEVQ